MRQIAAIIVKRTGLMMSSLLLLLFTTAIHTVMPPVRAHAISGMEHHNSAQSTTCVTRCTTAVTKRDDHIEQIEQVQDDELEPTSFVLTLDRTYYEALYSFDYGNWPPPSKIPTYKLNGVLLS